MGVTIGIKKLEYGFVQPDGSPATAFKECHSLQDTLTFGDPTTTDVAVNVDQLDDPVFSRRFNGPQSFTINIPDADNDTYKDFTGGTITGGGVYEPPAKSKDIHMTIRITPDEGFVRIYNDCSIEAHETGVQGKTNAISLQVTCTISKPKDGSPTYRRINTAIGQILTVGSPTAGSGYQDGTYTSVPLTGGSGAGATANITIESSAVTEVEIVDPGYGYQVSDSLSADAEELGGGGSGFKISVSTVSA